MLFMLLNLAFALFFAFETAYVTRVASKYGDENNPVINNILLAIVPVSILALAIATRNFLTPPLFTAMLRLCFLVEGILLVNIAFCFPYYAWKHSNLLLRIIKLLLYIGVFLLVHFKFRAITVTLSEGMRVESDYLFTGLAHTYFPWTWVTLFHFFFRYLIPAFMCILMLVHNDMFSAKLGQYKGYLHTAALAAMWLTAYLLQKVSAVYGGYNLLHFAIYIPLLVIIPAASWLPSAPSGKALLIFILKWIALYILPALILGLFFVFLHQFAMRNMLLFAAIACSGTGLALGLVTVISEIIQNTRLGHTSDYATIFEKELAAIDYTDEMDSIANTMFKIFRKNAEASSMSVFINGGNSTFETAYSSTGRKTNLTGLDRLFESLLNIGKTVVIYNELETLYALVSIKDQLEKFFSDTHSDALFILNEGRDVHGFILLGLKESRDHYREYDLNIFTKLYSYFFVFGYYMRNISNKEIIGTVNRELRMSSQIITSIQENIDALNNPKIDAGHLMIPAHNIGGEFVDMIRLTDTRHLFVVGDLSGKGIAASMSMVILKAIIRAYLAETHDFKQLVVKVNSFIRNNLQKGTIFSGMFAIMNFENDTLYYINCGIPAMLLYTQAYNNVIEIQGAGHYLGFVSDIAPYLSIKQIKLHESDIVLTCTHGLTESHSLRGEEYGKERIQRNMVANSMYPAHRMVRFLYDDLTKFMSHEMEDDVSILVLKYLKTNETEKAEAETRNEAESFAPEQ